MFIGGDRAEVELVPAAGYQLHRIDVEGLSRSSPLRALRAVARAVTAFLRARRLLGELRADAVMGAGGYVAGPVGLAAVTRSIPLVLTEADSHLGLTNRLLAARARRVCLAFEIEGRTGPRYLLTGRPAPALRHERKSARARLGIADGERCVLVFGGSLGARSINQAALEAFADGRFRVLHVSGRRDYPELQRKPRPQRYELLEYLDHDQFSQALAAADLVVARAGGSVMEIAQHGLPAILVPYPHASSDHQTVNARWMANAGAAIVIADSELTPRLLAQSANELLDDPPRLQAMASASLELARPGAAEEVARELLRAARR